MRHPLEKCSSEFSSSSSFLSRSMQRSMPARTVPRASATPIGRAWACCQPADADPRRVPRLYRPHRPLKGIFAVHSWIVFKPENATSWSRYDMVGWGQPVRTNGWAPDARWFGDTPRVLVDVRGSCRPQPYPEGQRAIAAYRYNHSGNYRIWPDRTATPLPLPCCGLCRNSRPRCRQTPWEGLPCLSLSGPDRQRHRHRSLAVGCPRREARLGRGRRSERSWPGRRPRSTPSRREVPGLRPCRG